MNITVVGLGSIGLRHARNFAHLGCRVRTYDTNGSGDTPTLDEALANADGAVICTPPESHIEVGWRALSAGAHLMIEKPISIDLTETGLFLSRARQAKQTVLVGYPWRYDRSMNEKRRRVLEDIGPVQAWGCRYAYDTGNATALRMGPLLDCSHAIDFLRWMLGEPAAVTAEVVYPSPSYAVHMRFGLAPGLALLSLAKPLRCEWQITGEHGAVDWIRARDVTYDLNDMYLTEAQHFLACCRGEAQPLTDGWDARETLRIALAARKASEEGRWIAR